MNTFKLDDEEDLAITGETYNIYRRKTGKGGDFLAPSPATRSRRLMILPAR